MTPEDSAPSAPPLMHLPYPGFIHFGHFMPQCDINVLHLLASKTWAARGRPLIVAEIGSFTGASALALVNYAETLYCIDTWEGGKNHEDPVDYLYYAKPGLEIIEAFKSNTRHIVDKIAVMQHSSLSAVQYMDQQGFDLVFIDGDHRYESVAADIRAWLPLVRPGGILCGHDYDQRPNPQFPGVVKAVNEAFLGPIIGHSGFRVLGNVWWREI